MTINKVFYYFSCHFDVRRIGFLWQSHRFNEQINKYSITKNEWRLCGIMTFPAATPLSLHILEHFRNK